MISNLVGNIWMLFSARHFIQYSVPSFEKVKKHIKPGLILLFPNLVTTLYAVIDKTMIGILSSSIAEVGYYEQSQKIIYLSLSFITSFSIVMLPRFATTVYSRKEAELKKYINIALEVIFLISVPISIGICVISNNLVPWFFGDGFDKVSVLIKVLSPLVFLLGISDLLGTQFLVAIKREKQLVMINVLCVIINIACNIILIQGYQSIGASIATLIGELIKCIILLVLVRKYLQIFVLFKKLLIYFCDTLILSGVIIWLQASYFYSSTITNTGVLVIVGFLIYILLLIIEKNWIINKVYYVVKNGVKNRARHG